MKDRISEDIDNIEDFSTCDPDEEEHLGELLRMNFRRKHAAHNPDVNKEWLLFKKNYAEPRKQKKTFTGWQLLMSGLTGAAAMLALVFLLQGGWFNGIGNATVSETTDIISMQHDNSPQRVKLDDAGSTTDLTQKDSISYQTTAHKMKPVLADATSARMQRLSTPRGMDFKVMLSDGSEVWLNAESSIEFPASFRQGERRVKLKGEAYFKVARNEHAPFVVESDQLAVKVLGTEFNFKSYASETASVALVDGKIEVMRPGASAPDATLKPGEAAWYDNRGTVCVKEVDMYAVTQWVKGFFYFHDEPLVKVLCDLGRWYNLGVVFHNTDALHYKVHFSALRNEDVALAVESLNSLRRIRVRLEDSNLVVY